MRKYLEHIIKSIQGNLTIDGQEELAKAMNDYPELKNMYQEYKKIWQLTWEAQVVPPDENILTDNIKNRLKARRTPIIKQLKPLIKIAAIFVLAVIVAVSIFKFTYSDSLFIARGNDNTDTLSTENKEQLYILPDESRVWLNKNSTLVYFSDFTSKREMNLTGEAFFEVKKLEHTPFRVTTANAVILVKGTSFNVASSPHEGIEKLHVKTGEVLYRTNTGKKKYFPVKKGKQAYVDTLNNIHVSNSPTTNYTSWHTNTLKFKNTRMSKVISDIEKHFDIIIRVSPKNQDILPCRFTGIFPQPEIKHVLSVIGASMNITYENINDVYILKKIKEL